MSSTTPRPPSPWTRPNSVPAGSLAIVIAMVAFGAIGCTSRTSTPTSKPPETDEQALVRNPDDLRILCRVSRSMAQRGDFEGALALMMPMADRFGTEPECESWLLDAYFWALDERQFDRVEQLARLAVEHFPDDDDSHRRMARWFASTGRRQEASEHVAELVRRGVADERETLSLIQVNGPFQLVSFQPWIGEDAPDLFALGRAREVLIDRGQPGEARRWLDKIPPHQQNLAPVLALRGRVLANLDDAEGLTKWMADAVASDTITDQAGYWLAVGQMLQNRGDDSASIAPLVHAVRIDCTNRDALRLLVGALTRLGDRNAAADVRTGLAKLDRVFRIAASADAAQSIEIGGVLESLARPREALRWYHHARERGATTITLESLVARAKKIDAWEQGRSPREIDRARLVALVGDEVGGKGDHDAAIAGAAVLAGLLSANLSVASATPIPSPHRVPESSPIQYQNVAPECGLATTFRSDYQLDSGTYWLHQVNGGGMAAVDFDRDGNIDVYVMQSGGDPRIDASSQPNQLYRNVTESAPSGVGDAASIRFDDVSPFAGADDRGFGQGVCAGDWNQDGFPDLLLANIGRNRLLVNQGDGTFRDVSESVWPSAGRWTSSVAMGDLDGDQLPDIVEVNYIDDEEVFGNKCTWDGGACRPQDFRSARDRMLRTTPDGRLRESIGEGGLIDQACVPNYGMGVVLGNLDRQHGNDVFISNDADLNHWYQSQPVTGSGSNESTGSGRRFGLFETAGLAGCAVGASGVAQACMGVAAGDWDRDGELDLAVTNFHNEPMNLFRQTVPGVFVDEAAAVRLSDPSRAMLGFGTQSADVDNDGWDDLVVLNGHLYDARDPSIAFRMPPQLFRGGIIGPRSTPQLAITPVAGNYFATPALGRTLVRCDLNRDGAMDWVANHLDAPVAVLVNQTKCGHWLELELVGTTSPRDPVGAWVDVRAGDQSHRGFVLGGDGYMATNEPVLHFGLGMQTKIDSIEIHWPDGLVQRLRESSRVDGPWIDGRWLVVQDMDPVRR